MKWIFSIAPQDMVAWLLNGKAKFVRLVDPVLDGEELFADMLCEIRICRRRAMLHIEFQKRRDSRMGERLWNYNVRATMKYKCPVWSCVIYLRPDQTVDAPFETWFPNGWPIHNFRFSVLKMWETPTDELLATRLNGVLPLLPLSREGQNRDVIETGIQRLMPQGEEPQRDLLSLLYGFSSLILISEEDQDWLVRRFEMLYDILRETRAFQEMAKEGRREGVEQGKREGMQQGLQQGIQQGIKNLRQVAENLVATRFSNPTLTTRARKYLATLDDAQTLQELIVNLAIVQTPEDVRQLLSKK